MRQKGRPYALCNIGLSWEKSQCKRKVRWQCCTLNNPTNCSGYKLGTKKLPTNRGLLLPKLVILPCPFGRLESCSFGKNHNIVVGVNISPHSFIVPLVNKVGVTPDLNGGTMLGVSSEPNKMHMFHFLLLLPPLEHNPYNPEHHGNKCNCRNDPILPINHCKSALTLLA